MQIPAVSGYLAIDRPCLKRHLDGISPCFPLTRYLDNAKSIFAMHMYVRHQAKLIARHNQIRTSAHGMMVQAPAAASAGIAPFAIQMSINGCIGSVSFSVSNPNSFATVIKCTKHELRSVHPCAEELSVKCQKGSTQYE